jgi:hypothetical protein
VVTEFAFTGTEAHIRELQFETARQTPVDINNPLHSSLREDEPASA